MNETREQLKEEIRARATDWLQRDKSGKGFICPKCGSGSGKNGNGTGITSKDGIHFRCWAGDCFEKADIIDIIGLQYGLTDYNDKLQKAAELILGYTGNVRDLPRDNGSTTTRPTDEEIKQYFEKQKKAAAPEPEPETDCTEFFRKCAARINETDYHREISAETLHRFQVGYCPDWINPKAIKTCRESGKPLPPATPRLIIPTSKYSYLARDTRENENLTDKEKEYSKTKFGKMHIFNLTALDGNEPVYIVEGEIDALSIIDAGAAAIGLGSTSMVKSLIEYLKTHKPAAPLILSLDNDKRGAQAQGQLVKGLKEQKIPFICFKVSGEYKDPNEYLMKDKEGFTATVSAGIRWATETPQERYLRKYSAAAQVQGIIDKITAGIGINAYTPTGFQQLDDLLDGGLFPGLYVIGALSSAGKTTLALQIANQIAASGKDVLYFSLEMDKDELAIKSISRISYLLSVEKGKGKSLAKTTRGIMTGARWAHYRVEEEKHLMEAFNEYSATEQHLLLFDGVGNIGAKDIEQAVKNHIDLMGTKPVVFIDYLQILAPTDPHYTDKQNTDQAVLALKRLSRDLSIPIFAISSFNRENYNEPVSMTSFKESGAIEYSSDVLIGLQPKGWDYEDGDSKQPERKKRLAEIKKKNDEITRNGGAINVEIKVLKNRNGSKGVVNAAFMPCFNYFSEIEQEPETEEGDNWVGSTTDDALVREGWIVESKESAEITAGGSTKIRGLDADKTS